MSLASEGLPVRLRLSSGLLAAMLLAATPVAARAAERKVLLVAAIDSYADLKRQLGWLGGQTENPGLSAMVESLIMLSTQGRGLAGLDVKRPLGVVVTSDGADVGVHGFLPVKDLDKLLAALQGVTGPAERDGDTRRVTLPNGLSLAMVVRDGWAVVAPDTLGAKLDPSPLLMALAKDYTVGIEAFPGRMSEQVRRQLESLIEQGAAAAAAQGQTVDRNGLLAFLENLRQNESLSVGLAIDDANGEVFLENRSVGLPGSVSAAAATAMGKGTLTVGTPPLADGTRPAIHGYVAQTIPADAREQFLSALDQTLPRNADDPLTRTVSRLVYDLLSATLAAGGIDAAVAVDTSVATRERPVPAVTAALRVKDGKALERQVKNAFGGGDAGLPGVRTRFDTGKAGVATLHTVSIDVGDDDLAERIGRTVDVTLAVAPDYAILLAGGDPGKRVEAALAASGRPVADAPPIAGVQVAAAPLLEYATLVSGDTAVAKAAAQGRDAAAGLVELRIRPIERGVATRLSIDAAGLKAAARVASPPRPVGPGGVPLPEVPPGFPIPLPGPR